MAQSKKNKAKNQKSTTGSKSKRPIKKKHGTLLIVALILMAVSGIIAAFLYNSLSTAPDIERPRIVTMMVIHSLADVVAAFGIFYWKKWALYVYAGSTILALVAGLLAVGAWSVFYMILPFVIVGWLLRTKWDYFD